MLRLAGRAVLSRGVREVDNWFCKSYADKHCLNGHVDPSKAHLSQDLEVELKGWRFMHCADLEASFVGSYEQQVAGINSKVHELAASS
jgi:hypothetical protein